MTRIYVALCVCVLMLAGCVSTTKAVSTHHYALGSAAAVTANSPRTTHRGQAILKIARIDVPPWLAGTDMYYRLQYRHDGRLAAYGRSDWVAPPATLLEPLVQHTLAADGQWRAVVGPGSPAMADASLHLRLEDFSQTFARPKQSTGVLDATATLVDNHNHRVITQKHFHIVVAAPSADAQGGVKALEQASRKFAVQLERWLQASVSGQNDHAAQQTH